MQTQIAFTTDKKLKEQVVKKTKRDGITLKWVLNQFMQAYADDQLHIGITSTPKQKEIIMTPAMKRTYKKAMKDREEWKDIYSMDDLKSMIKKR